MAEPEAAEHRLKVMARRIRHSDKRMLDVLRGGA